MITHSHYCSECGIAVSEFCAAHPGASVDSVRQLSVSSEEHNQLEIAAKADAELFFNEFSEVLDPKTTDWDGTAYQEIDRDLRHSVGDSGFPIYQAALIAETERLVKE